MEIQDRNNSRIILKIYSWQIKYTYAIASICMWCLCLPYTLVKLYATFIELSKWVNCVISFRCHLSLFSPFRLLSTILFGTLYYLLLNLSSSSSPPSPSPLLLLLLLRSYSFGGSIEMHLQFATHYPQPLHIYFDSLFFTFVQIDFSFNILSEHLMCVTLTVVMILHSVGSVFVVAASHQCACIHGVVDTRKIHQMDDRREWYYLFSFYFICYYNKLHN